MPCHSDLHNILLIVYSTGEMEREIELINVANLSHRLSEMSNKNCYVLLHFHVDHKTIFLPHCECLVKGFFYKENKQIKCTNFWFMDDDKSGRKVQVSVEINF